ncbi:Nuclear localization sequence-binding protein [Salix suchowensis]|nr:Nuclear localization sequence-binding protein [Salix suchowensis]
MAKSDKKAVKVDKKIEKADKKAKSADSKPKAEKPAKATTPNKPLSTKEILSKVNGAKKADKKKADAVAPAKSNSKAKEPSSDEDSESDSEDEKPKAAQFKAAKAAESSSDSDSDSDDDAPAPPPKKAAASKPAKVASPAKATPAKATPAKATPAKTAAQAKKAAKAPSSIESSDSSSEDEAPVKPTPAKVATKAPVPSSSSDSDSSDEEEEETKPSPAKKAAPKAVAAKKDSSDSDSDSSSEDEPAKPMTVVKAKPSDSSDESSDDDSDVEMGDSTKSKPAVVTNGKRKADDETAAPPKKIKMANGDAAPAGDAVGETKTVFVGKLSWSIDDDMLAEAFAECGEIISATVQIDRNTGRSRGFGYVHFTDASAVEKALAMNETLLDGRVIKVDKARSLTSRSCARTERRRLVIPPALRRKRCSFGVSEDLLWEFFGEYGPVKNVRLPTDRESGKPKGFGYVEFHDVESATKAYEGAIGQEIEGRSIRLDYSQPRDNSGGGGFGGGRGGGRGGFGGDRGGRGGGRGGRGGFGDRGGRGGGRGGRGGFSGGDRGFGDRGRGRDEAVLLVVVPALAASLRSKAKRLPSTNCVSMQLSGDWGEGMGSRCRDFAFSNSFADRILTRRKSASPLQPIEQNKQLLSLALLFFVGHLRHFHLLYFSARDGVELRAARSEDGES